MKPITMGFHPTARGFGWAGYESPLSLVHHGVYDPEGDKNLACLRRLDVLLGRHQPDVLVLEAFDQESSRSERIRRLCRAVVDAVRARGIEVVIYRRSDVQTCFARAGARSRYEIAMAVARHTPALQMLLPPPRKPWVGEDKRLSVFSAAALVLTHYHTGAVGLLEDLQDGA